MARALVDVQCESVGLPACLAKCSKAIMGELQYAKSSGATSIFEYSITCDFELCFILKSPLFIWSSSV